MQRPGTKRELVQLSLEEIIPSRRGFSSFCVGNRFPPLQGEGAKEIENQDRRKGFGLPIEKPEDPKKVERLIDMFGKFPLDLTPENLSKMRGDEHNKRFSLVAKKSGLRET